MITVERQRKRRCIRRNWVNVWKIIFIKIYITGHFKIMSVKLKVR